MVGVAVVGAAVVGEAVLAEAVLGEAVPSTTSKVEYALEYHVSVRRNADWSEHAFSTFVGKANDILSDV